MPRTSLLSRLTIEELKKEIKQRGKGIKDLRKQRSKLAKELAKIDAKIARTEGSSGGGTRVRNDKPLPVAIAEVLKAHGKAMNVGDIADAVQKAGYKSNSANFRGIVNQALIKERKTFSQESRGMYALKK